MSRRVTNGPEPGPLIERFSCLFQNLYCPKTNPSGIVSLGIAENLLCAEEILSFSRKAITENLIQKDLTYGDNLWGSRRLNEALAGFLNRYFNPAVNVDPEHIITGVGVSAILDHLFHTLLDAGDGVLILNPYYAGFDRDLVGGRSGVKLVGVDWAGYKDQIECQNEDEVQDEWAGDGGLEEAFEKALQNARADGVDVRAILICNPHNPLGITVSRSTLIGYCKFAQKHDLHLVSDEIYAMSVYENKSFPGARPFCSALSIDLERDIEGHFDKGRLHCVYGMSKDFSANGFRIGALITQHNPRLLRTLAQLSIQIKISSPADVIFSTLLTSDYLPTFLRLNQSRLSVAQERVRTWFERRQVVVRDCNAGHFVWVNLGPRIGIKTRDEETRVFQKLLDGGLYVAPGSAYHHKTPGWFRVTFSVPPENLEAGLERLEDLLNLRCADEL
ncbi:pyridoxal phosphate-dependent transferase [Filobasidium floriforme]|uniref:pyridoxal phosphate-dependent transferase n=1 Tax=Filobasidium floriforme TaxID=5210 RepID=UPI001E8D1688|nr:pyridoxal phosphate-dependent transferase [Filobasidium floriforme]KAH8085861.1 pyridoxal phosphate-dependent transferase [Filobasidium floriforme]